MTKPLMAKPASVRSGRSAAQEKRRSAKPETCPAEALLREWADLVRQANALPLNSAKRDPLAKRRNKIQHSEISHVIARSDVGAAFQLLLSATAWPFRPGDPSDSFDKVSDEIADNLTDGNSYKTRLALGAYFHTMRGKADPDLRTAEIFLTAEHIDGEGVVGLLLNSGSQASVRGSL